MRANLMPRNYLSASAACRRALGVPLALPFAVLFGCLAGPIEAASPLGMAEGHINFYKHTTTPDDTYTRYPSRSTIEFMNSHWLRLLTFSGYWDQNDKLTWYPNAWTYADAYAIYSDPNYTDWAHLIQEHPDWILRDGNGNPLYIPWGCSGGTCPQYAANITDPNGFRAWWISQVQPYVTRNLPYKGVFIDDVNLDLSRICDGNGNPVIPVDPNTHLLMTADAWRGYFADYMEQVRTALPGVEIIHNTLWFLDWADSNIQREIRAADWINLERGVNDSGLTGGTGYWSLDRFLSFVDNIHANGKAVIFDGEAPASDSDAAREYSAASYLLISTGADLVGDSSQTPTYWWEGFETDLGAAISSQRYVWENLWRRDFAWGMALVNPPGSKPVVVTLPGPLIRLDGSVVNNIMLKAGQGAVLRSPGALAALTCDPTSLTSGANSICTVTLTSAAPPAGAAVTISSSNQVLSAPGSAVVPAGTNSASFSVQANTVHRPRTAVIRAQLGSTSLIVTFQIGPLPGVESSREPIGGGYAMLPSRFGRP